MQISLSLRLRFLVCLIHPLPLLGYEHPFPFIMPSVLKPNLIFLASFANVGNALSTFLHYDPSAGCLNILSCLRSSLCHRINLAFILFMNKRFRCGIRGKYHITLAGTLFLTRIPSTSPGSSQGILYRHALHTGHESKFSYSSPR